MRPAFSPGLVAMCSTIFVIAGSASGQNARNNISFSGRHRQLAENVFVIHISPPQSGVRLIEEVFQRVRSSPEIAMSRMLKQQQQAQNLLKQSDNLAIRPKQQGQIALLPSPSLQWVAAAPAARARFAFAPNAYIANAGGAGGAGINETDVNPAPSPAAAPGADAVPPAPPVVDAWLGTRHYPTGGSAADRSTGLWDSSIAIAPRTQQKTTYYSAPREVRIIDERPVVHDFREAPAAAPAECPAGNSAQAKQAASPIGTKYGGATESSSAGSEQNTRVLPPHPPDLLTTTARMVALGNALRKAAGSPLQTFGESAEPNQVAAKKAETVAYDSRAGAVRHSPISAGSYESFASGLHGAVYKNLSLSPRQAVEKSSQPDLESVPFQPIKHRDRGVLADANIAVLPPNVFTGITLVRLGIPESQANNVLNAIGTTRQERVDKWVVTSWQRKNKKNQTALQLYVRNGLLDAMRVFDPSLIGPEFGVNMGDVLTRLKERFGEPAFILAEPGPGAGQNYIYPISQVGFQLARQAPGQQPRVVSVLIFNVR